MEIELLLFCFRQWILEWFSMNVSSDTPFFPGKQMGRRRQVPFQLIFVLLWYWFFQSFGDGDGIDGDDEYWCLWEWVPPGPSILPLLSLPNGCGDFSSSVAGSNLPCLIFFTSHPPQNVLFCLFSPHPFPYTSIPTTSNELCAIFLYYSPSPECSSSASSSLSTSRSSSSLSGSTMSSCLSGFFSWGPTSVVLSMECAGSTCFLDKHSLVQFCCTAVLELLLVLI